MRARLIHLLYLPSLLFMCVAAHAADTTYEDRWYLAPGLAYISPSSKEGVGSGTGCQFSLGKSLALRWDLEFGVLDYSLDFNDGIAGSADHSFYGAEGLWLFNGRDRKFTSYLLIGGGADAQRVSDVDSTKPYGTFGLGFAASP